MMKNKINNLYVT